jgi:hypothetical protein
MARAVKDIEREIRGLSSEDKVELIRTLIAELDAPADANVERAWLETSQRRYRELVEGRVEGVPGPLVSTGFANVWANEVRVPSGSGAGAVRSGAAL